MQRYLNEIKVQYIKTCPAYSRQIKFNRLYSKSARLKSNVNCRILLLPLTHFPHNGSKHAGMPF